MRKKLFRRICRLVTDAWYWLRCHTFTRYHLVDCRNSQDGYYFGFQEPSELIFYAAFKLLERFVAKEDPFHCHFKIDGPAPGLSDALVACGLDEERAAQYREDIALTLKSLEAQYRVGLEIKVLYDWWKTGRTEEHRRVDALYQLIDAESGGYRFERIPGTEYSRLIDNFSGHPKASEYFVASENLSKRDQEMLERLIQIRRHLWT